MQREELYPREGQSPEIKTIFDAIERTPLPNFSKKELQSMLTVLQKEVRTRISELRKNDLLEDSRAYQHIKRYNISTYAPRQKTRAAYMNAVKESVDFLSAKTSLVEGATNYRNWLEETFGVNLTKDQKKKIWKNIHTAEKDYATKFEQHGYGMVMQHIAEATKGSDYTKFSPAKIKKILDELGEERRATVAKLQEGVKEPWANKREDLHKEYDKL